MTDLVPIDPFVVAEKVAKSNLIPAAYRNKPTDAAICMMYGAEVGLPPMTALQRIIVINGKPTLDAQGMAALIRGAGHSLVGDVTPTEAKVTGKRGDNGDTMSFTFTIEDAKRANLVKKGPWTDYPKAMLWARAVSQLARQLFPDVLMGMSYVPEEIGGEPEVHEPEPTPAPVEVVEPEPTEDIVDAEVVEPAPVSEAPAAPPPALVDAGQAMAHLATLIRNQPPGQKEALRGHLISKFGPGSKMTEEQIKEATIIAENWPPPSDEPLPPEPVDDEF